MPIVLGPLLIGFATLAVALVLLSLHHSSQAWLRPLLDELAHPKGNWLKRAAFAPVALIVRAVLKIEHRVTAAISTAAAHMMSPLAKWLGGLAHAIVMVPQELERLGDAMADAVVRLVTHTIPSAINRKTRPIDARAKAAQKSANRSISLTNTRWRQTLRNISALAGTVALAKLLAQRGIDILRHERVVPRIKAAEQAISGIRGRELPRIRSRLKRLEKALGLGIIAGLVLRTLVKVAPWIFCRNVKKVGTALCGLNSSRMDDLLALLVGVVAVGSLEDIVRFAQSVEEEITGDVKALLGV